MSLVNAPVAPDHDVVPELRFIHNEEPINNFEIERVGNILTETLLTDLVSAILNPLVTLVSVIEE